MPSVARRPGNVFSGSPAGQGHDITYSQIAADRLGIDVDDITLVEGDTDMVPFGNGTWGSRCCGRRLGDNARRRPHRQPRTDHCRPHAGMRGRRSDYAGAIYSVRGTDRRVTFRDVADMPITVRYCLPAPAV